MKRLDTHFTKSLPARALAAAVLLGLAAPSLAQQDAALPKGNSAEEVAQRRAANEEQLRLAEQQNQQNASNAANYQQALSEHQAAVDRYEQEKTAAEAEKQRLTSEHEAAMEKWRADVAACEHGDRSRCAPPPAATAP